jgi:hypothetical protein
VEIAALYLQPLELITLLPTIQIPQQVARFPQVQQLHDLVRRLLLLQIPEHLQKLITPLVVGILQQMDREQLMQSAQPHICL